MHQVLSDKMKSILLKIGLELKKFGWKPNSKTSEIDIHQGHLELYRDFAWDGEGELPNVNGTVGIDITFGQNEQNNVHFLVYNVIADLNADGVQSTEKNTDSDWDQPFTEQDVNNASKIQLASKQIHGHVNEFFEIESYEYAQESYSDWKDSTGGGWKADDDQNR